MNILTWFITAVLVLLCLAINIMTGIFIGMDYQKRTGSNSPQRIHVMCFGPEAEFSKPREVLLDTTLTTLARETVHVSNGTTCHIKEGDAWTF